MEEFPLNKVDGGGRVAVPGVVLQSEKAEYQREHSTAPNASGVCPLCMVTRKAVRTFGWSFSVIR